MIKKKCNPASIFKSTLNWLFFIIGAIAIAISLRVFLFDTYIIPTPSMEPAIMAGDHVIVNKLIPGPRIIKNVFSLRKGEKPDLKRLKGWSIKRNDILTFNFPYSNQERLDLDMSLFYAKRCVAIPADTFYIENGFYKIKNSTDTLGYYINQRILSNKQDDEFPKEIFNCFPYDARYNWNMKNFGPLYIPAEGDEIAIDSLNILLYRNLIAYETQKTVTVKLGAVLIGDSIIKQYTFTKNYYFMAGDFVFDSKDSRYWGLLPEDHITGKISFVWNTKDIHSGKTKWNRFLKRVK